MKKIMFALAIAMVAGVTQAASVTWALATKNAIKDTTGAQLSSAWTVYLMDTGASGWSDTLAGLQDGSITASGITSAAGYLASAETGTKNTTWGKTSSSTATSAGIAAGSSYNTVFVAFDTVGDDKYVYVSGTKTATGWDGSDEYPSATATAATWGSADFSTANWTKISSGGDEPVTPGVPEPTSGLLMLVGLGALALRRRRA